ncbi:Transcription factor, fungi [Penicillium italicum]|uniref:Transcription factor, fungi n=1 Tax=Penicillium italicum TaxID=40296 RepID=A0A0A2KC05_PENIT|nr:Transcription factor, fungi [Penicillium italicum]
MGRSLSNACRAEDLKIGLHVLRELATVVDNANGNATGPSPKPTVNERPDSPSSASSSSLGSLDGMDSVNEDLNRSEASRATGYIGKNSEIAWMQRLVSDATKQDHHGVALGDHLHHQPHQRPVEDSIASTNYYLDHYHLHEPNETSSFSLPPKALADQLLHTYFNHVHVSLPIIRQDLFTKQYCRVFSKNPINPGRKWLAVLNMIFAISSQIHRLSQEIAQSNGEEKMFFGRAKSLNISENVIYDHADLQQIQAEALMAFYLLSLSQINRSWKMIGIATRSAIALGLNLRITNERFDLESKESRKRLWWSIFYLEHILSVMTGRVSYLGDGCCTVSPPMPSVKPECLVPGCLVPSPGDLGHACLAQGYDIQWTNSLQHEHLASQQEWLKAIGTSPSSYFFYLVDLIMITQTITNRVYSTDILQNGWAQAESRIGLYSKKLDQWVSGLHTSFAFEGSHGGPLSGTPSQNQVSLALHYYSARIILNRPCLTLPKIDQENGARLPRSRFSNSTTLACLRASLGLIAVLPKQPDMDWAHNVAPWWCLLHFVMQSTTVLLLQMSIGPVPVKSHKNATAEISAGAPGTTESRDNLLASAKKALRWLHCLGMSDESARRAFELCNSSIRRIALTKDLDLDGVPFTTAQAPGFSHSSQQQRSSLSVEASRLPSLPQDQGSHDRRSSQQMNAYDERGDHALFPESIEAQTSSASLRYHSAVLDTDIDMQESISNTSDFALEEMLLTIMGSNVQ